MKKIFCLLGLFLVFFVTNTNSQTTTQVGDPTTYMTPEQLAKYNADIRVAELEKKLEVYGKWVGVGGEVGTAIREGLDAVVDVSDKFGKTDVGKYTMILVAWKVIGKDIVRIILGFIFIFIMTLLFIKVYNNTFRAKKILIENSNPGFLRYPKVKKYEIVVPDNDWDGYNFVRILMLFMYAGAIGISYAIMFG